MQKNVRLLRDGFVFGIILILCFLLSILMQDVFSVPEQVTTSFAFAVFLISLLTDGYFWGLAAAGVSVILVNYAFTFPYFQINFRIPSNFISAVVMTIISVLTSALTTKVKRQEALKAETEKEKMRANLLRAISHDLRTPLTAISGSISAVLDGNVENEQQKRELLEDARTDAEWLYRMVENLLSITKITDDKMGGLNKQDEMLEEVLAEVALKFRKYSPDVKLSVSVPDELMFVPMDAVLIEQVLINFLNNAVAHGVNTSHIRMKAEVDDKYAVISVTDNGAGIAAGDLEHIFDGTHKFSNSSSPDKGRSLGIGLSVCKTIIEAHGGGISASNTPEGGACFSFTLPLGGHNIEYQG